MVICALMVISWLMFTALLIAGSDLGSFIQNLTQRSCPWVRPGQSSGRALLLHTHLQLLAVLDVNEKEEKVEFHVIIRQRWRDEVLSWDPSTYGGLTHVSLPASQVWTPDIRVREALSESRQQQGDSFVSVSSSGWVRRSELLLLQLHSGLSLFLFPFDKQAFNITLGSYLHTVQDVLLQEDRAADSEPYSSPGFTLHGEWDLLSVRTRTYTEPQGEQLYSRVTYQVELGRCSLYYVVNLVVPSALVLLIDLAGYAIPVESSERIPFKVTLLLGYIVFLMLLSDLLPPFREHTPVIGLYLVVCLVFLCLSMAESVLLLALGQPDALQRFSTVRRLAALLCRDVPQNASLGWGGHSRRTGRRVRTGLQRSYGLDRQGAGLDGCSMGGAAGCGCGCVLRALADELEEVSEELQTLTQRRAQRSDSLLLMEALDRLCLRIYSSLLLTFLLSVILLWALYR